MNDNNDILVDNIFAAYDLIFGTIQDMDGCSISYDKDNDGMIYFIATFSDDEKLTITMHSDFFTITGFCCRYLFSDSQLTYAMFRQKEKIAREIALLVCRVNTITVYGQLDFYKDNGTVLFNQHIPYANLPSKDFLKHLIQNAVDVITKYRSPFLDILNNDSIADDVELPGQATVEICDINPTHNGG